MEMHRIHAVWLRAHLPHLILVAHHGLLKLIELLLLLEKLLLRP
jgi:hypothetical protein